MVTMSQTKHLWKFVNDNDLKEYTLIIPSVAVGNVGQLACDLLISSLKMKKIASVYSPALVPVAGYDPYDLKSSELSSSCEAYQCDLKGIVILQLRAPLVLEYAQDFLKDIVLKFKEKQIKDIVVLSSSFAYERKSIMTSAFRYLLSEESPYTDKIVSVADWLPHEKKGEEIKIHGGGFATLIYDISKENGLPCLVIYKYCAEGDNIPDAYEMVKHLASLLPLFDKENLLSQLIQPVSWKLLFGSPPPIDIY